MPVCWGAKPDEELLVTAAVAAVPDPEAAVVPDAAAVVLPEPLAAVVRAPPVPVALVPAPVVAAVAPVVQLTAVGTWTPWAEQICWA